MVGLLTATSFESGDRVTIYVKACRVHEGNPGIKWVATEARYSTPFNPHMSGRKDCSYRYAVLNQGFKATKAGWFPMTVKLSVRKEWCCLSVVITSMKKSKEIAYNKTALVVKLLYSKL